MIMSGKLPSLGNVGGTVVLVLHGYLRGRNHPMLAIDGGATRCESLEHRVC